jgi:hypothetical protein
LLGQIAARGAGSPPCGDNDGGDVRHGGDAPEWTPGLAHEGGKRDVFYKKTIPAAAGT